MKLHAVVVSLAMLPAVSTVRTAEPNQLDPTLPYQAVRSKPVTYDVDFSAVVTPPYKGKVLKVWLPMPQTNIGQEVTEVSLDSFPVAVEPKIGTEKVFGNTFAYFEFHDVQGGTDHPP